MTVIKPVSEPSTITDLEKSEGSCELINGEIIRMSPAGGDHGWLGNEFGGFLRAFVNPRKLGRVFGSDTGFIISRNPDTVRSPDASFVGNAKLVGRRYPGYLPFVPDLAVEIVSPSDTYSQVKSKARMWVSHGTGLVWIVDPGDRQIEAITPTTARELVGGDVLDGGTVLPGFTLSLTECFENLP